MPSTFPSGAGAPSTDHEEDRKQEAEARAKAARDADRDWEQPKITLRAPVPPKQVKAEPESEESPAWGCLSSAA